MLDIDHTNITDTFGWTASPVWKKFAINKNGEFIKGDLIKEQSIKIKSGENDVVYSAFRRSNNQRGMNTQIKAYYKPKDNFIVKLRKKGSIYTPFAFLNKLESVELEDYPMLNKYVVRTNNKEQCSKLFKDNDIESLFGCQDLFCIEIKNGRSADEKILYAEINGIVDSDEGMENSLKLITKILSKLS